MGETLLNIRGLKTYFYTASGVVRAVDGVSFQLEKGKTMGIVGESGSGKSVTANSIIRLLPPAGKIVDGEITFDGKEMMSLSQKELQQMRGSDIAMIFQDPMTSLDPVFRVGDQMVEMIREHNKSLTRKEAWDMSLKALHEVGIPSPEKRMKSYPHELSGGMCQRVIIAMAVCCKPKLLIADEPTTALDVTVQAQVLDLMSEVQKNHDTAILLVTHNLGVIWKMADSVMVMYAGNTVEHADTKTLYQNPLHPYTWGLLDSMPTLSGDSSKDLNTIHGTPPDLRLTGTCCNFYNRCKYASKICEECVPPLQEIEPGHFVACHRQCEGSRLERKG